MSLFYIKTVNYVLVQSVNYVTILNTLVVRPSARELVFKFEFVWELIM